MKTLLLFLSVAVQAAEPRPVLRFEHAFDTVGGWSSVREFSRDGKTFVVQGNAGVTVWDAASGVQRALIPVEFKECGKDKYCGKAFVAVSPDGKLAVIQNLRNVYRGTAPDWNSPRVQKGDYGNYRGDRDGTLELWDIEAEKPVRTLYKYEMPCRKTGSAFQPFQCADFKGLFSPDGRRLAFTVPTDARDWGAKGHKNYQLALDDASSKPKELAGLPFFTADGRLLSVAIKDLSAEVRDEDSGKRVSFLQDYWGKVWGWSASTDGSVLAFHFKDTTSERGRVWDTATGKLLVDESWTGDDYNSPVSLILSPDGRRLIRAREEISKVEAVVHDLRTGATAQALIMPAQSNSMMTLSPDGGLLSGDRKSGDTTMSAVFRVFWEGGEAPAAKPKVPAAARLDVDAAPAAKTAADPDAYAVVIGVERYRQEGLPAVDYASRDAETMSRYLVEAMGFEAANVVLLQNEKATKTDLEKHLGPWLANRVNEKSRVFVYYAGHGAPNPATGKGYLIPYEGDPNYTEITGYPIQSLYDSLAKLPAREAVVVLDSCFSGQGGRSLLAKGARPLVATVKQKAGANTTVLSAASGAQISASYPEGRHGLLSYFLFEGLHGAADADKDGTISTAELFAHARKRVEAEARRQNLEQTPMLLGSGAEVWLRR